MTAMSMQTGSVRTALAPLGNDTGESQGWDAKDVGRPAATVKGEDTQKNVWGLADWSQPRPLTEIEVNVLRPHCAAW